MFASMSNKMKLNVAVTRFAAFVSGLPLSPDELDVLEYHSIIKLFEEACGQDLSQFRIAPDRMKSEDAQTTREPSWRAPRRRESCIEFTYFRGQIRGLIACLMDALSSRPC
jgi:hypothetical protein